MLNTRKFWSVGGAVYDSNNYSVVLFRGASETQLKNAVHGLRIVGGFCYALQGVFRSVGLFLFAGVCSCMPVLFSGVLWRFLRHCGRRFRFDIAVCALLFALVCSVMGQILSLLRFVGVGSILYRVIFYRS